MEFLTDFGKAQWEAQERFRKIALEEARVAIENTKRHQADVNARMMDRVRIQALGKATPFGNEAFTGGNRSYDYDQNRQIIEAYISTRGIPDQKLPAPFTTGGSYGGVVTGGRIDVDSLIPVLDQPSFSLMENVLQRNQENYEANELLAEYNDDQISETELEKINESRVKVMDILRGITAKLSSGIKGGEAFVLSFTQDLTKVYQELLNYGYGYPRQDLERIRVYLEEEPALIELDIGQVGEPINKLALDILNRIVRPMLSPSFIGTMKEKKALMESIIESFYKTIDPSESGNHIPVELRIQSYDDLHKQFESVAQIYAQMVDIQRRQGTQQTQRLQNDLLALKRSFDSRAERLFGTLLAYSKGSIYTNSQDEIRGYTADFKTYSPERKLEVLQNAVDLFVEEEIQPEPYDAQDIEDVADIFSQPVGFQDVEEPLRMPEVDEPEVDEPEVEEEGAEPEPGQDDPFSFAEEAVNLPPVRPAPPRLQPAPEPRRPRQQVDEPASSKPEPAIPAPRTPASSKPEPATPTSSRGRKSNLQKLKDLDRQIIVFMERNPLARKDALLIELSKNISTSIDRAESTRGTISTKLLNDYKASFDKLKDTFPKTSGSGGRKRREPSRSKIHNSAVLRPETFKKFIEMIMKHFDDSSVIRRI